MHRLRLLIIVIGIFQSGLSLAQESSIAIGEEKTPKEFTGKPAMVIVEPSAIITSEKEGEYALLPYVDRRGDWGTTFSFGYSSYEPVNYEPNFLQVNYEDVYSAPDVPMLELTIAVKRNLSFGSIGGEIGVGVYVNDSDAPALVNSELQLIPVRVGGVVFLDSFRKEPLFVPYFSGGIYTMIYKETLLGNSFNGNTQIAPYINGGIAIGLDWLDRLGARISYEDSGIQTSYAYAEARKFFQPGGAEDPDFENDISWGAGVRVEF